MIDPKLKGKTALVTGANHGIGAAIAKAFARQGVRVFVTYLRFDSATQASNEDEPGEAAYRAARAQDAARILAEIKAEGGQAAALEADLGNPQTTKDLFDNVEKALGPVEILVNNAAHWEADSLIPAGEKQSNTLPELWTSETGASITAETADRHFAVNSRGAALVMAEYTRRHVQRDAKWGRIINVSTDGSPGFAGEVSYGASKAALESYSRAAAAELGQFGITLNIISPGPIQTQWITPELEKVLLEDIPLGRIGYPEDIANVALFLASEQAGYVTGQTIHVGGGHRMI